jgi:hypothetical protein
MNRYNVLHKFKLTKVMGEPEIKGGANAYLRKELMRIMYGRISEWMTMA